MKHKIRHYAKHRPIKWIAIISRCAGLVFLYAAFERANTMFGSPEQGVQLFFSKAQMAWMPAHYGQIGIVLLAISFLCESLEHIKQAHAETPKTLSNSKNLAGSCHAGNQPSFPIDNPLPLK